VRRRVRVVSVTLERSTPWLLVCWWYCSARTPGFRPISPRQRSPTRLPSPSGARLTPMTRKAGSWAVAPVPDVIGDASRASHIVEGLVGTHAQVPPAYSAIKRGGRVSHRAARAGTPLELEPRHVRVLSARLTTLDQSAHSWTIDVTVSKGTYIRALARDLGETLGTKAHLSALRRTASAGSLSPKQRSCPMWSKQRSHMRSRPCSSTPSRLLVCRWCTQTLSRLPPGRRSYRARRMPRTPLSLWRRMDVLRAYTTRRAICSSPMLSY